MPIQSIKIGNILLKSSEMDWDRILKISRILRKIAKWDPNTKVWTLNWRIFYLHDEVVEEFKKIRNEINGDYLDRLLYLIREVLEKTPSVIENEDYYAFLVKNHDPYDLAKKLSLKNVFVKVQKVSLENIGDIEAPYITIRKSDLIQFIQKIEKFSIIPRDFLEKIKTSFLKIEKVIKVFPFGKKYIKVIIPRGFREDIINKIIELGTIRMFVSDPREGLKERVYNFYRIERMEKQIIIRLPSYSMKKVIDLLQSEGIRVEYDYKLPLDKEMHLDPKIELIEYQKNALENWSQADFWGTIVIPTGGGKTYVAMAAIAKIRKPTIIFVPNLWLLWQWVERLSKNLGIPKVSIGVVGGGEKKIKDITVITYQSGRKIVDEIGDNFAFVIFDEGHHVPASTFKNVALYLRAPFRMALSATPKRSDGNEILLFKLAGGIVFKIDYPSLVREGVVAPLVIRKILVPMPSDLELSYNKVKRELNYAWDDIEKKRILNKLIEIARDNPIKLDVISKIVERHKNEKIFIFSGSIDFAEKILQRVKSIVPAALLTAKTSKADERRIIKNFISGVYKVLILVKKGEEGVDIGDASVAIIAGGSKQRREIIQRIGRVLRGGKEKLAWVYEIVTGKSIEEHLSKARATWKLVKGLEKFIKKRFGVEPYKIIKWNRGALIN